MTVGWVLLRETSLRLARSAVHSIVAALIVGVGAVAVHSSTGLALASQQRSLQVLNSPEGRLITVTDHLGTARISSESVGHFASLPGVSWVLGLGGAKDMVNPLIIGAESVAVRPVVGELPAELGSAVLELQPGRALISVGAGGAGLGNHAGPLSRSGQTTVVVGSFDPRPPLEFLDGSVLSRATGEVLLRSLLISVQDVSQLEPVADAVPKLLIAADSVGPEVTVSGDLAAISDSVVQELQETARLTLLSVVILVAVLIGVMQFGRVTAMARDIGRRRALGATRSLILAQVLLSSAITAVFGVSVGTFLGAVISVLVTGQPPSPGFALGVAILLLLAALLGALPPAVKAAWADPVRVLRVP